MKLSCLKKIFTGCLFILPLIFIFASSIQAQTGIRLNRQEEFEQIVEEPTSINKEFFDTYTLNNLLQGFNLGIKGQESIPGSNDNDQTYLPGAIHVASQYISYLVTQPPSSSVDYIADIGSSIGLAKPAYAQEASSGYQGLTGVLKIWKAFRNIAYAFFVIIFVVVGFMIMFRAKLNPQTVVSLQLALPKLIVTLLLITFSYAIAGLILDLMYLSIYLAVNTVNAFLLSNVSADQFFTQTFVELIKGFNIWGIADSFSESIKGLIPEARIIINIGTAEILGHSLIALIISIALLFSIIKLLFQLIIAYINIILQIIFSPIILLFNALPNANTFTGWIKNLVANAAAFPATAIMILIGQTLISTSEKEIDPGTFIPPMLNFFEETTDFVTNVIGLGIILLLPKIVQMIQEALKAKPALPAGAAAAAGIGQAFTLFPGSVITSWRESRAQRRQAQLQAEQLGKYMGKETPQ